MTKLEEHLRSRGVDFARHHVWLDNESSVATFPLWNLSGQLVGYQQYNPNGVKCQHKQDERFKDVAKYWTYKTPQNTDRKKCKAVALWGLESLTSETDLVFVTEGVFDAVTVQNCNETCLAVMSNDPNECVVSWLHSLRKPVVVLLDRDEETGAGNKLRKVGHFAFMTPAPYKDLNEMPVEESRSFLAKVRQEVLELVRC